VPPRRRVRNKNKSVLRMHYTNIICACQTAIGRLFDTTYTVVLLLYDLYCASSPAHTMYRLYFGLQRVWCIILKLRNWNVVIAKVTTRIIKTCSHVIIKTQTVLVEIKLLQFWLVRSTIKTEQYSKINLLSRNLSYAYLLFFYIL